MLQHVHQVFANENFEEQPQFVIDTGCGDGHLLQCIYEHVKNHTPRGKVPRKMAMGGPKHSDGFPNCRSWGGRLSLELHVRIRAGG